MDEWSDGVTVVVVQRLQVRLDVLFRVSLGFECVGVLLERVLSHHSYSPMLCLSLFIQSHSQEGLLILISHMRAHQFSRQSKGAQAGLGHRDSIRSWFCHLDFRHMPSLPASSSLSLLSFVLLSVADHSCHYSFDIPHDRCHIIAARSRSAHHN